MARGDRQRGRNVPAGTERTRPAAQIRSGYRGGPRKVGGQGLRRRREEILGVARKRKAHRVAVFGSVARGEARPGSAGQKLRRAAHAIGPQMDQHDVGRAS